jgi:hypothetical protein
MSCARRPQSVRVPHREYSPDYYSLVRGPSEQSWRRRCSWFRWREAGKCLNGAWLSIMSVIYEHFVINVGNHTKQHSTASTIARYPYDSGPYSGRAIAPFADISPTNEPSHQPQNMEHAPIICDKRPTGSLFGISVPKGNGWNLYVYRGLSIVCWPLGVLIVICGVTKQSGNEGSEAQSQ